MFIFCSLLKESLPGVATSSAAAPHLSLPLLDLLLLLDVEAAQAKGAAVASSQAAVSEPLKQEDWEG